MGNGRRCMGRRNKGCERDHSSSWQFTSSISCEKLMLVVTRCYLCFKWVSYSTCITKQALENEPARPQKGELESLLSSKGVKSILCQLSFQYCLVKVVAPVLWPIRKEPFQSTVGRNGGLNPFRSVNCANFSTNRIQSQHQSRRYRLFSRASGNLILMAVCVNAILNTFWHSNENHGVGRQGELPDDLVDSCDRSIEAERPNKVCLYKVM